MVSFIFRPSSLDTIIRFFLYFLILFFPYNPVVIEICIIFSLIVLAWKRLLLKDFRFGRNFINKFIFLACGILLLGSILFHGGMQYFFVKILDGAVIYFLVIEVFQKKQHVYVALGLFTLAIFVAALTCIFQFYFTQQNVLKILRLDPHYFIGYIVGVIPFLFALVFMTGKKLRYRFLTIFFLSICVWALILTFSRGALLAATLGIVFVSSSFHQKFKIFFKREPHLVILSVGILAGIFAFVVQALLNAKFFSVQLLSCFGFMVGVQVAIINFIKGRQSYGAA